MAEKFEVTGQQQTFALGPGNRPVDVMRVTFMSKPSGTVATVDVPTESYSAEAVARAILERVDTIESVHEL